MNTLFREKYFYKNKKVKVKLWRPFLAWREYLHLLSVYVCVSVREKFLQTIEEHGKQL